MRRLPVGCVPCGCLGSGAVMHVDRTPVGKRKKREKERKSYGEREGVERGKRRRGKNQFFIFFFYSIKSHSIGVQTTLK